MPSRQLSAVAHRLEHVFGQSRRLVADVQRWSGPGTRPYITQNRKDLMVELAFLKSFLAWERFLEESFVLYLLGKRAPRGRKPHRFAVPPDAKAARELISGNRPFAKWDGAATLDRASLFFRGGRPYTTAIEPRRHMLKEAQTVRNAIAHESQRAQQLFEALVRNQLGTLPPKATVGWFLSTPVPAVVPPQSFVEHYLYGMESVACQIVPV